MVSDLHSHIKEYVCSREIFAFHSLTAVGLLLVLVHKKVRDSKEYDTENGKYSSHANGSCHPGGPLLLLELVTA